MGTSYNTNVIMHVDQNLSDQEITSVQQDLAGHDGLVSACVHERARHLWVIDYDPRAIRSSDLLSQVRNKGLSAQLIF